MKLLKYLAFVAIVAMVAVSGCVLTFEDTTTTTTTLGDTNVLLVVNNGTAETTVEGLFYRLAGDWGSNLIDASILSGSNATLEGLATGGCDLKVSVSNTVIYEATETAGNQVVAYDVMNLATVISVGTNTWDLAGAWLQVSNSATNSSLGAAYNSIKWIRFNSTNSYDLCNMVNAGAGTTGDTIQTGYSFVFPAEFVAGTYDIMVCRETYTNIYRDVQLVAGQTNLLVHSAWTNETF